jgi:hypothetical protein
VVSISPLRPHVQVQELPSSVHVRLCRAGGGVMEELDTYFLCRDTNCAPSNVFLCTLSHAGEQVALKIEITAYRKASLVKD